MLTINHRQHYFQLNTNYTSIIRACARLLVMFCVLMSPQVLADDSKVCSGEKAKQVQFEEKGQWYNCEGAVSPKLKEECRKKIIECSFEAGAGVKPFLLSQSIAMIILTFVFLWVAWVVFSQYQSFVNGEITFYDLSWRIIRALIVLLIFTVFIRP